MCVLRLLCVSNARVVVLNRCEPRQPFFVNVNSKRVDASQRHINPQVELVTVEEQRIGDILAHYLLVSFAVGNFRDFIRHNDSLSL